MAIKPGEITWPWPAAGGENSPGLTRMSPGCGTRRLGISASRRRRRSGGSNLGGGFLLHLRWRCWNCASVTHGSISVRCSHIATACCVALVVVVVVTRLPRCRNNAFISVACAAATTHTCGSPSSSLSLSSSLLFNVMHRPWRLHPRRRNRAQTRLLKKFQPQRGAARRRAAAVTAAAHKSARWKDKQVDEQINSPGFFAITKINRKEAR